ncbi:MAG: hypothetical protein K6G03_01465, partial [Lachnospiraceae bacterium]|nr:hypothetical protein [Lachnospiraceae bacterium]
LTFLLSRHRSDRQSHGKISISIRPVGTKKSGKLSHECDIFIDTLLCAYTTSSKSIHKKPLAGFIPFSG